MTPASLKESKTPNSKAVPRMPKTYPILEFDEEREAVIEPSKAIRRRGGWLKSSHQRKLKMSGSYQQ